jgi:NADPH-dependent 2,4-dienoyl-CoA reductase/sulfur reductase-like enzyme/rhodanese-related sulfurtransferase
MKTNPTIVIVGGVAGGASAATRARRCNENANIILFEKDSHVSFANCGLPYFVGGEITDREKLLVAKPVLFRDRFNIDVRARQEVTAIDPAAKTVSVLKVDSRECYEQSYDKLILAPGATPVRPPIPGADSDNVFTLRNLDDADLVAAYVAERGVTCALVVGAGFIGLEMVEQLHGLGVTIALVELQEQVLPPLDPEMAAPVRDALLAEGIDVRLGTSASAFEVENNRVHEAVLSDGTRVSCDMVLMGIGVRPNVDLAEAAGLTIGGHGGIDVDAYMRTSDPDVYAVGDVVAYPHGVLGEKTRVPLAGPANRAGRIAGEHAATDSARPMASVLGTAIVRVFEKTAACTGINEKVAASKGIPVKAAIVVANNHAGYYPGAQSMILKLLYAPETGIVLGAQAVGGGGVDKRIDVIATALQMGATVYDLAGLDLTYAPPFGSAKDPVHMAAFVACNDLSGVTPLAPIEASLDGVQVVDVRTDQEYAGLHLPGSVHIPVDELRARVDELNPKQATIVTCQSGLRAHTAARILCQSGFDDVRNLTGGMLLQRHAGRVGRD